MFQESQVKLYKMKEGMKKSFTRDFKPSHVYLKEYVTIYGGCLPVCTVLWLLSLITRCQINNSKVTNIH